MKDNSNSSFSSTLYLYRGAIRIFLLYIVFGSFWIVFPDSIVFRFIPSTLLENFPLIKSFVFLFITGIIILVLIISALKKINESSETIQKDSSIKKNLKDALANSRKTFTDTIRNAPFPVILFTIDGEIISISECWERELGYTLSDIPSLESWIYQAERDNPSAFKSAITDYEALLVSHYSNAHYLFTKSEARNYYNFTVSIIGHLPNGEAIIRGVANDISELKALQDENVFLKEYNPSTKLLNRQSLLALISSDTLSFPLSIIYISIDFESTVNIMEEEKIVILVASKLNSIINEDTSITHYTNSSFLIFLPSKEESTMESFIKFVHDSFEGSVNYNISLTSKFIEHNTSDSSNVMEEIRLMDVFNISK